MKLHDRVVPDTDLPKKADAVVIGAGIIGIATALELAERGLGVVVVEKGEVAGEQSSRNWGWVRQMGRDPREIPLIKTSMNLWHDMNARVGAETGFRVCGVVYLSETERHLAEKDQWHRSNAAPHGLSTRMISSGEIDDLLPGGTKRWAGGMYTPDDGRAEPFIAVPAMARALQKKGGKIFTQCAARGLERQTGRVSGVVTEAGPVATGTVVLAGGYWSRRFLNNLDIRFPQLGVVNSVMRTAPLETGMDHTFSGGRFAVRRRMDGGYTVAHNHLSVADMTPANFSHFLDFLPALKLTWSGLRLRLGQRFIAEARMKRRWALDQVTPFEQMRVLDPEPVADILEDAARHLRAAYPAFAGMQVIERWAGMIDATPDAVPVIDKIDSVPGLFLASGFSGHGFGLGPGAGKLMAELVTGEPPCVDPTPFRYSRFIDGTKLVPTTGL